MYAAGKIPGSFFRREGRPTDQAILTARLIDRPLRPSFADGFRNETQVVGTIIGADLENPHDVIAINAASASLMLSGIPFEGPIGAVRVAFTTDGTWIPFPTALLATHTHNRVAALVYSTTFFAMSLIFQVFWGYATRRPGIMAADKSAGARQITWQYFMGPVLYLIAIGIAFVSGTAVLIWSALVAIYFAIPARVVVRK